MLKPIPKRKFVIIIILNFLSIDLILIVIIPEMNIIKTLVGSKNIINKNIPIEKNRFIEINWFIAEIRKTLMINSVIVKKTFKIVNPTNKLYFFLLIINLIHFILILKDIIISKIYTLQFYDET